MKVGEELAQVEAARVLLEKLGVSPADLLRAGSDVPVFAEYVPRVAAVRGRAGDYVAAV